MTPKLGLGGAGVTGDNHHTADLQRLLDAALARWGRVDAVVNSAGHGPKGALLDISDEDWHVGLEFYLLNVVKLAWLRLMKLSAHTSATRCCAGGRGRSVWSKSRSCRRAGLLHVR